MNKLSILLPHLTGGGAERVAVNLANTFILRGYRVDLVLMSVSGELLPDLRPEIRVADLQAPRLRNVLFPLVRYLREARPDALLACMWPLTVIAVWARGLAWAPTRVVVAEHTTWTRDEIAGTFLGRWKVRTSMHLTFPGAEGVIAVSEGAADDLARFARLERTARPSTTRSWALPGRPFLSRYRRRGGGLEPTGKCWRWVR